MSGKSQKVSFSEDVESWIRRKDLQHAIPGVTLTVRDQETLRSALLLWAIAISDLSEDFTYQVAKRWLTKVIADFAGAMDTLAKADEVIAKYSTTQPDGYSADYSGFCRSVGGASPTRRLLSPFREAIVDVLQGDMSHFRQLRSALLFVSRLTLRDRDDLEEKAISDYVAVQDRLAAWEYPPDILAHLNAIIRRWYADWTPEGFVPRNGDGQVAENVQCELDKFQWLNTPLARYTLKKFGIRPLPLEAAAPNYTARYQVVPKGIDKKRGVCMEPANLMFLQQGLRETLDFSHHPYLRRRIDLRDASKSAKLAWEGSITRLLATIDLSSASDSVTLALVEALFQGTPLLKWLRATRSRKTTLPDGTTRTNVLFAPMGSALCFPVECIVFCAFCEAAIEDCGGVPERVTYRVYGDDIVIPTQYADRLMFLLEACGFLVNREKSFFSDGPFREACGGEYYDGVDVSPIRLSRWFTTHIGNVKRPQTIMSLVDLANRSIDLFPSVRRFVIAKLELLPKGKKVLFTDNEMDTTRLLSRQSCLGLQGKVSREWSPYAEMQTFSRSEKDRLQIRQLKAGCLLTSPPTWDENQELLLWEWLRRAENRRELSDSSLRLYSQKPITRWVSRWHSDPEEWIPDLTVWDFLLLRVGRPSLT